MDINLESIEMLLNTEVSISFFELQYKWFVEERDGGYLIQIGFHIRDNDTGLLGWQKGGKQYVSKHCTKSEVIGKAWDAFKKFMAHEMAESFFYRNVALFNPHVDMDKLSEFMSESPFVKRNDVT